MALVLHHPQGFFAFRKKHFGFGRNYFSQTQIDFTKGVTLMPSLANVDYAWIGQCVVNLFLFAVATGIAYGFYRVLIRPISIRIKRLIRKVVRKW